MPFVTFMQSPIGRTLRIVLGLALIGFGLRAVHEAAGLIVALIGVVPLIAGTFGVCLVGPLFGVDFRGYTRAR
jgi:hypothetical protein